jgi:hypothetical protein
MNEKEEEDGRRMKRKMLERTLDMTATDFATSQISDVADYVSRRHDVAGETGVMASPSEGGEIRLDIGTMTWAGSLQPFGRLGSSGGRDGAERDGMQVP